MSEQVRIAVLSSKGGCGRSTVAINLAYTLAGSGRRVALVDLAQFGSLALLLQATQSAGAGMGSLATCLSSSHRQELRDVLESSLCACRIGSTSIHLLPAADPPRQDDLTVEQVHEILHALSGEGFDLVIDTSHELSDRLAGALHAATHRLWVLSPDPAAGWHAVQALEMARDLSAPDLPSGILVNRYHRQTGLRPSDLESAVGLPVWGLLPDLPHRLPLAAHQGVPLVPRWHTVLRRTLAQCGVAHGRRVWWLPWRRGETHGQI